MATALNEMADAGLVKHLTARQEWKMVDALFADYLKDRAQHR
ncbi:MAG: hypothetical protein ACRDMX_13455 [Solirubrobacteraceae bacterium]